TTSYFPRTDPGGPARQGGPIRAHAVAPPRRPVPDAGRPLPTAGRLPDPRRRRPPRRLPCPRLPARPRLRRGPLLGLVPPPRLELLQQGAARRLAHPWRL